MERILIIAAVLVCVAAAVAVAAMSARSRRPELRLGNEFDERDEPVLLDAVGDNRSPIDRSARILDAQVLDLEPVEDPKRIEAAAGREIPNGSGQADQPAGKETR